MNVDRNKKTVVDWEQKTLDKVIVADKGIWMNG